MNKILFLDIDGVLNARGRNEDNQAEIRDGRIIDRKKVKLLGKLIRDTGAKIVLHSGWRFWFDENKTPLREEAAKLVRLLEKQKIAIYDMTPDLSTEEIRTARKFSLVKAKEILAWLDLHKDVETWAVLDDLDLHNDIVESRQIRTDAAVGLTVEDVKAAEELLNPSIETFDELYEKICCYDRENRITRKDENTITVRLEEEFQIQVYDNTKEAYLEISQKDAQYTHFHPDYREAYEYLREVLEEPDAVVEEMKGAKEKSGEAMRTAMICFALFLIGMLLLVFAQERYPGMSRFLTLMVIPVLILAIVLGIILSKLLYKYRKSEV